MPTLPGGNGIWLLGLVLLIPFLIFGAGMIETGYFLGLVIFVLYLCILIINFEAGFLALIFIRSGLDCLKNFTAAGGVIIGAVSIALIVLGVFYVLYSKINILKFEDSGPFLIFLAFCGISMAYSPDFKASFSDWLRMISVLSVYLLTRIIFVTQKQILRLFAAILISSLLPVVVAYYQLATGHGAVLDAGQHRVVGTFLHPNPFATYLMILLTFLIAQILEGTRIIPRFFMGALASAIFVIFIFTFSRGAWISFAFAMAALGFLRYRKILGFMPVVLIGSFLMIPGIKARIINIFDAGYSHGRSGWEWRLDTWSDIAAMVAEKPLFGHGLSAVIVELGVQTHNDYLRLVAEVGLMGLLAYLWLSYTMIRQTWRDYKSADSNISESFQAALLAAAVGLLVRQCADNTLRDAVVLMYFWIFAAISRNIAEAYPRRTVPLEAGGPESEALCAAK